MSAPEPGTDRPAVTAGGSGAAAGRRRWLPWATAGAWAAVVGLWLADALGRGLPPAVDLAAVLAALVATGAWVAGAALRLWRADRRRALALAALLILAGAVCFTGLDHELGGRSFGDEGTYLSKAHKANEGVLLRPWFIYPHLLFYLDALALWAAGLAAPLTAAVAGGLYGVTEPNLVDALVARAVTAAMGALAALAVFALARRIATVATPEAAGGGGRAPTPPGPSPTVAGLFGGLLIALSPLWVGTAQLNLSDVAAAFFATLTVAAAAGLLDRESPRRYLLAGALAGLAAGSKYPAGLVAIAIFALWLRGRRRAGRRGAAGLALAAGAAIGAFLLATPSLLAFPRAVFQGGGADVLFGLRQYAAGGWTGVVRASDLRYYGGLLAENFGLPALVLGIAGAFVLAPAARRRLAWTLPFPAAYLALLLALEVAVPRNLLPVLPALAAMLGVGLAGLTARLGDLARRTPARRRTAALAGGALTVAALAMPAWGTGVKIVQRVRPTTRDLARVWIEGHLPPGSYLVAEAYTPPLARPFVVRRPRFAIRLDPAELRRPRHDFLLLSGGSYNRFLRAENLDDPILDDGARRYRELFAELPLVAIFPEEPLREGAELRLYRLDPAAPPWSSGAEFAAAEALVRDPSMAPTQGGEGAIAFAADGQWALFKAYLEPGRYRVRVEGAGAAEHAAAGTAEAGPGAREAPATGEPISGGRLRVLDRSSEVHASAPVEGGVAGPFELPRREKVFLYLYLPPGSRVTRLVVESG